MSSGPEAGVPRGEDWDGVEVLQEWLYPVPAGIDISRPHPARRYNYWLGGKDNFAADRESGDELAAAYPAMRTAVRENRRFLQRAVAHLAGDGGIRQFLDIGTGLPTADNTHEVAQRIAPESRIIYVDNDPLVMVHARALLTSHLKGQTAYIQRDLRDPQGILGDAAMAAFSFDEPIAVLLVAVLHFVADDCHLQAVVNELLDAMPPGSCLVLSHATADLVDDATRDAVDAVFASGEHGPFRHRTWGEIFSLIDSIPNWVLLSPGLVPVSEWAPDGCRQTDVAAADCAAYGGLWVKADPDSEPWP